MAAASPTPQAHGLFEKRVLRPTTRQAYQNLSRSASQRELSASQSATQLSIDSSDDELPIPMKLSAVTRALLNKEPSPKTNYDGVRTSERQLQHRNLAGADSYVDVEPQDNSPIQRRTVRVQSTPASSSMKRTNSSATKRESSRASRTDSPRDLSTPAQVPRTVRVPISSGKQVASVGSSSGLSSKPSSERHESEQEYPSTIARTEAAINQGSVSRYGASTLTRSRIGEELGYQSSMRLKRVNKVSGRFLSGPARRGRRRQSEEENEVADAESNFQKQSHEADNQDGLVQDVQDQEDGANYSQNREYSSGSPGMVKDTYRYETRSTRRSTEEPRPSADRPSSRSSQREPQPVYRLVAPPPPELPSSHDQENEAPPTFKRNKLASMIHMDKMEKLPIRSVPDSGAVHASSPERKALAPRSYNSNTPLRPAPPPPKMSVLETATANGGAATSRANKKRNNVRVNGKNFTRLDVIGRGGTSRVYRVMAENYKIYALKRVSLEDADESTIRGYKGEIDLLRRLKDVDRVVRLIDYEINDDRNTLSVLMEMGELDFNKMLNVRYNAEDSKFDPSFTRYYWREMLECLQSVHQHDIVHSDLKPANFVIVQGRLKLIDFGIANAIQTDETVNVHRDTQVGTPNYMSPESLLDTNQHIDSRGRIIPNQPKLVKIGKPSDVWSLGCILYQMVYGRPPFAHIQNQMSRCQAIINFNFPIEYPAKGVGDGSVPSSLIAIMKRCLERDQAKRPTVEQLLSERDPFLYPLEYGDGVVPLTEELLGRILQNVAPKCRDRTPSDAELLSLWPAGYFASIRRNLQEGRL